MGFYKNAMIGFTVQLLILLGIMAFILSNRSKTQVFPVNVSSCPDFYSINPSGMCSMETSVYSSEEGKCRVLNSNEMTDRDKKVWAVDCGVAWDGITNNSSI